MGCRSLRAGLSVWATKIAVCFVLVSSQQSHVLNPGVSLSVERSSEDVLVSENGTFKAGFYPVGENAFAFAIWFVETLDQTVVWMANRDRPVNGMASWLAWSNGNLALVDADGSVVWTTNSSSPNVVRAELLETGNLVLTDGQDGISWQSFDFPTDTLLPLQSMKRSMRLVSRQGDGGYGTGYYRFYFDDDNVLRLLYDGPQMSSFYWPNPDLSLRAYFPNPDEDVFGNGRTRYNSTRYAVLNEMGQFTSSDNLKFSAADIGLRVRRRLTMGLDGILRLYSLNNNTKEWEVSWLPVLERCRVHGFCGENGICIYTPDPTCTCPLGYSMKNSSDWTQGCVPDFDILCNKTKVKFVRLPHTDYYGYDLNYTGGISFEACKTICMSQCNCRGFGYRLNGDGPCYPKTSFFNGQAGSHFYGDMYLKVPSDWNFSDHLVEPSKEVECSNASSSITMVRTYVVGKAKQDYLKFSIGFVIAIGIVEIICITLGWAYLLGERRRIYNVDQGYIALTAGFRRFTYKELKKATKNFSDEIGRGGSGMVYKGQLEDGRVVAVKSLQGVNQGEVQFWCEVRTIGRINHMNLVTMWGFCAEKGHRLLVYEYMENGSLEKSLFSSSKVLPWGRRFDIALGTAKGLAYLHEECLEWVLHCDVKPQNILLDKDFQPKVADFGLSKIFDRSGSNNNSSFSTARGTRGYMAPEWRLNLPITSKVDVYSYGILVLEMATGRSSFGFGQVGENGEMLYSQLIPWIKEMVRTRQHWVEEIADPHLSEMYDKTRMELLVKVALQCVEEERDARPTMSQVVDSITLACQDEPAETEQ